MNESVLSNLYRQGQIENPTVRTIAKHFNRIVAYELPSALIVSGCFLKIGGVLLIAISPIIFFENV